MKKITALILGLLCIVSLTACGKEKKQKSESSAEVSAESSVSQTVVPALESQAISAAPEAEKSKSVELTAGNAGIDMKKDGKFTVQLYADGIKASNLLYGWKSDDPTIAEVDSSGTITAHSSGYATVTASDVNNPDVFVNISVHVLQDESSVSSSQTEESLRADRISVPEVSETPVSSTPSYTATTHFDPYNTSDGYYAYNYVSSVISDEDLNNFSSEEVQFLLNVIAAKHGYRFTKSQKWIDIFNSYDWYNEVPSYLWTTNSPDINSRMSREESINNSRLMALQ